MKMTRFASAESLPIHRRYIGTFPCISAIVTERDRFCDFQFAMLSK